jgi:hypothetical protein
VINYIRKVGSKVIEKGTCNAWEDIAHLTEAHPGEYREDDGTTQLSPISVPQQTRAATDPNAVSIEELTDAVIKLAAGDSSAVDGIALRRKRQIKKAEKNEPDTGGAAKRSAGRDKGASK